MTEEEKNLVLYGVWHTDEEMAGALRVLVPAFIIIGLLFGLYYFM